MLLVIRSKYLDVIIYVFQFLLMPDIYAMRILDLLLDHLKNLVHNLEHFRSYHWLLQHHPCYNEQLLLCMGNLLEFIHNFFQVYVCECLDMKKVCLKAFYHWMAQYLVQDGLEQMLIVQFQHDSFLGFYLM